MNAYEALRSAAASIDLSDRGKILVTGEDRARLLHAMSTNHVSGLAPQHALYAFFLNAQGRILADAYIYNLGDHMLLDTEPELREKLQQHLDKYIIADDVYLEDGTSQWAVIAVEGPTSLMQAAEIGLPVPDESLGIRSWENGFIARVASTGPSGVRVFVPASEKDALVQRLTAAGLSMASRDDARTVRIENGIPRYGEEITERFLVQETGALNAVHFNKGCYLGQEIVERVRSRAQVHRHLARVRIDAAAVPAPGTKLQAAGKDVAEIVSGSLSPATGGVVAFAYVRTEALADRPEMVVPGSGAIATLLQ